jgi:hypothetical protein
MIENITECPTCYAGTKIVRGAISKSPYIACARCGMSGYVTGMKGIISPLIDQRSGGPIEQNAQCHCTPLFEDEMRHLLHAPHNPVQHQEEVNVPQDM